MKQTPNTPPKMSTTQQKRLRRLNKKARPVSNRGSISPLLGTMLFKTFAQQKQPLAVNPDRCDPSRPDEGDDDRGDFDPKTVEEPS